jgi:hypothetical protein
MDASAEFYPPMKIGNKAATEVVPSSITLASGASVLVRLDHVACFIVNANHSILLAAVKRDEINATFGIG